MRFSLGALILLFTLIAVSLGAREAIHTYHWHRNMPVIYHLGAENAAGFPSNIKITFDSKRVAEVEKRAFARQVVLADSMFLDQGLGDEFWIAAWQGNRINKARKHADVYGFGQHGLQCHLQPFESHYRFVYPKVVRDLVLERQKLDSSKTRTSMTASSFGRWQIGFHSAIPKRQLGWRSKLPIRIALPRVI